MTMSDEPKKPASEGEVWKQAADEAKRERPEIKVDLPAIRAALWESRKNHTKRVRSYLP